MDFTKHVFFFVKLGSAETSSFKDQIREFEKGVFNVFQNRPNLKRLLLFFSENLEDFASFLTLF